MGGRRERRGEEREGREKGREGKGGLAPRSWGDRRPYQQHYSISTGQMLFLTPNQQCQSTEGKL